MKQYIINSFLHPLLSDYKIYRKWIGGEWSRRYIDYAYNDIWFLKSDPIPVCARGMAYCEYYRKKTMAFNQLEIGKLYQIVSGYENIGIRDENGEEVGRVKLKDTIVYLGFFHNPTIENDWGELLRLEYKFLSGNGLVGFIPTEMDVGFITAEIL